MDETWASKQLEKFHFGFDEADKDKSGTLSFDEVYNVLCRNGFNGSKTEAQFIFGQMDQDKNQSVTRKEFESSIKSVPKISIREYVYFKAFKSLDKDNSGFLTKSEIVEATKKEGGIEISAKILSDLLVYVTKEDDDEKVNYQEFLYVLGMESSADVMHKIFSSLDKDGSGFLTRDEVLDAVSNEHELKLKADKISQLTIALVRDGDHKLDYNEFLAAWRKERKPKN